MGEVYRARDTRLKREVALKILPTETAADPERLERFQREAETVAGLNHPNIVTLFSVEEDAGVHFLTMELVEGRGLDEIRAATRASHCTGSSRSALPLLTRSWPPTNSASCTGT